MAFGGRFAMLAKFRRSQMTVIPLHDVDAPWGRARARRVRHGPLGAAARVLATFREWRRRAHDRAQLAGLDDRVLRDIGLTRADAEFLSNKPFWRE
jgi:uncharacterized protein YjiS (DUF1127 family)